MPSAVSSDEYKAVLRENARLAGQNRKLQELVEAMREEIADANAEIAASKRLHDEQRRAFNERLTQERTTAATHLSRLRTVSERPPQKSVATNTYCEMSTSTVSDAATNTASGFGSVVASPALIQDKTGLRSAAAYTSDSGTDAWSPPRRIADHGGAHQHSAARRHHSNANDHGYPTAPYHNPPMHHHQQQQYGGGGSAGLVHSPVAGGGMSGFYGHGNAQAAQRVPHELRQFADFLARSAGYLGRDLTPLFASVLGAGSVSEVCATLAERDLVEFGVPIAKARTIMHLVMDHTSMLLSVAP
jgi:hypothetical protein